jgi:hypothetical protein
MTDTVDTNADPDGKKNAPIVDKDLDNASGGLNPQPLPPRHAPWRELNPQPLPP